MYNRCDVVDNVNLFQVAMISSGGCGRLGQSPSGSTPREVDPAVSRMQISSQTL